MAKSLNEMSLEELKIKAYDMIMLNNKIQNELNQIQQLIFNKNNQRIEIVKKDKDKE